MEAVRMGLSGTWLQDAGSISSGNTKWLIIFVGIVAFSMLVQAIAVIVLALGAIKARKRGLEIAEDLRVKVLPIIAGAHELIRDNSPKVKVITENFVEASHIIRSKAQEFDVTASDLNSKTRAQAARVDGMVTSVLNATAEISDSIQRGIKVPMREVAGMVTGLKAGLDVLVGRAKGFGSGKNGPRDRDPGW